MTYRDRWTEEHGKDGLHDKFSVYKTSAREPYPSSHANEYHPSDRLSETGEFILVLRPHAERLICIA